LAKAYERGWSNGFHRGCQSGEGLEGQNIERLEQRTRELEQSLDDATRVLKIGGEQVVEVGKCEYR
jgi:hypothetical protein